MGGIRKTGQVNEPVLRGCRNCAGVRMKWTLRAIVFCAWVKIVNGLAHLRYGVTIVERLRASQSTLGKTHELIHLGCRCAHSFPSRRIVRIGRDVVGTGFRCWSRSWSWSRDTDADRQRVSMIVADIDDAAPWTKRRDLGASTRPIERKHVESDQLCWRVAVGRI